VSNGGKFKLYTVQNSLIFPTPTQLRISFERAIHTTEKHQSDTDTEKYEKLPKFEQHFEWVSRIFKLNLLTRKSTDKNNMKVAQIF
jgi:hypothetical protein